MLKNYFKTAIIHLQRNRIFSFINILGLTIGLAACLLVATVVMDDLSYDRQWSNTENIYRINTINKMGEGIYDRMNMSLAGLHSELKNYPEVQTSSMFTTSKERLRLSGKQPDGVEVNTLMTDTSVWKFLDLEVLEGNPKKFVSGTTNLLISESFKSKFFPNENPVGKTIYSLPSFSDKPSPIIITGVIKDIPSNSIFRSDVVEISTPWNETLNKQQYGTFIQNFVLLKPGVNAAPFIKKFNKWYAGFVTAKNPYQFELQPLKDVYLHSDFAEGQAVKGSYRNIFILSAVALLLLIIACVNFVNLSTARAIQRLKETGVRKILGAGRKQIVQMFLTESVLYFSIAAVLATGIYWWSLPPVEIFLGHHLEITFVSRLYLFIIAYATILLFSFLIGFYPAWILSGFGPATALKGKIFSGKYSIQTVVRKSLVVFQFSISILILIALIIVWQQLNYMKNKDIGFEKNNLLSIGFTSWNGHGEALKNHLLSNPGIESASITSWIPSHGAGYMSREINDPNRQDTKIKIWYIDGDIDLAKTLGFRLHSGRLLNKSFSFDAVNLDSVMHLDSVQYANTESRQSSIITAYTAKVLHVSKLNIPIKEALTTPVGIIDNINNESLKKPMEPAIIIADKNPGVGGMLVRIKPGNEKQDLAFINETWRQFFPGKALDIQWVDDMLNNQYKAESKLQQLFIFFSSLSMLLAALVIFGLMVLATAQRVKEIGVRKVLGASVNSIVRLFSIDFFRLVVLAFLIASAVAWWLMNKWLQGFAYRIEISWGVFLVAGLTAIVTALVTVSFQAIKAAAANPVESLRKE